MVVTWWIVAFCPVHFHMSLMSERNMEKMKRKKIWTMDWLASYQMYFINIMGKTTQVSAINVSSF